MKIILQTNEGLTVYLPKHDNIRAQNFGRGARFTELMLTRAGDRPFSYCVGKFPTSNLDAVFDTMLAFDDQTNLTSGGCHVAQYLDLRPLQCEATA